MVERDDGSDDPPDGVPPRRALGSDDRGSVVHAVGVNRRLRDKRRVALAMPFMLAVPFLALGLAALSAQLQGGVDGPLEFPITVLYVVYGVGLPASVLCVPVIVSWYVCASREDKDESRIRLVMWLTLLIWFVEVVVLVATAVQSS